MKRNPTTSKSFCYRILHCNLSPREDFQKSRVCIEIRGEGLEVSCSDRNELALVTAILNRMLGMSISYFESLALMLYDFSI